MLEHIDLLHAAVAVKDIRMLGLAVSPRLECQQDLSTAQEGDVRSPDATITTADPPCGCQQADQGLCPLHPAQGSYLG